MLRERLAKYTDALRRYSRALKAIEERDTAQTTRIELELAYSGVRYRQGKFDDAVRWAERAAAHAQESSDRTRVARMCRYAPATSHRPAIPVAPSNAHSPSNRRPTIGKLANNAASAKAVRLHCRARARFTTGGPGPPV